MPARRAAVPPRGEEPVPAPSLPTAPVSLAAPDWLAHRLAVSGPADVLAGFRKAAVGAGSIPWLTPAPEREEGWFALMMALPPARRGISVAGARILGGQLGAAVQAREEERACPLDLHALVPVPVAVLRLGPDAAPAQAWLWENWGTIWPLRGVAEVAPVARVAPVAVERRDVAWAKARHDEASVSYAFHAADWSPWRALTHIRARWPALRFDLRPDYAWAATGETEALAAAAAQHRRQARERRRAAQARPGRTPGEG